MKLLPLKGFKVDHIGVAVRSVQQSLALFKALGLTDIHIEEVKTEDVRVGFVPFENQASIEFLEPLSDSGVIAKFLDKRGEGIHHICLKVKDLDATLGLLKKANIRLVHETGRPGARGCRVAFIHPQSASGVLIELSEDPK